MDIPIHNEMDQHQSTACSSTWQGSPRNACIHQLVAACAATMPDSVALVAGEKALSYTELNQRANQLAHYLQAHGVGPNVLVGLCIERSLDMVVGMLGILKAGGAYVPLDPGYPSRRLAMMLKDAQVSLLVTQQCVAKHLADLSIRVICLDADAAMLAQQSMTDPDSHVTVADLVYVIYTSGSTGQPKGVAITHDSLLNLVFWHQRTFAVTPSDRSTQVASPAFDAAGWELWPYLTIGASVWIPTEETRMAPTTLRDWLIEHRITIAFLPTVLAERVMVMEWPAVTALRFLLTGGDTLHHYPPDNLPFSVINNYGPTETTVVATSGYVPTFAYSQQMPSIGRPIANTQIYILDEHLQHVPIEQSGEIYIGGAGLARGYLNRPELTGERFIPHPFSSVPGARLYKTGDLARYLPDGQIAFLGRADSQVKIRGYRIELGEIEAVLNQHPAVRQAVVAASEEVSGEKYLVAYLVIDQLSISPISNHPVSVTELQQFLQTQLPDYMIPATFVRLEELPLTPNGKVDRTALPLPGETNTGWDEAVAAPETPIEKQLAQIMAELLSLEQIGIDDNFFLLGGHSLLGTQIIVQVARTFGVDVTLRTIFEAPSVRQLSAEIEQLIIARVEAMSDAEAELLWEQLQNHA